MRNLVCYFDSIFQKIAKPVVTIIGTGGKTSLMFALAEAKRHAKTLVTTTTHIGRPREEDHLYDYFFDENHLPPDGQNGVTLCVSTEGGKIKSLPLPALEKIIPLYDYTFIEGDGSRTLPLKGWADYEPVLTQTTNITIGIVPLWTLGMPANNTIIHRLPLFLSLTGAHEGDTLEPRHFVRLITGTDVQRGLFSCARGKKILFFNQVEDDIMIANAKKIAAMLPSDFTAGLDGIIAGSVHNNSVLPLKFS
jgi:probable selenium-dependent hydroxylase accessory protein YqeC